MRIVSANGKMPEMQYKPYKQVQIKKSKLINFQTGKDSFGNPIYLLNHGVEEVVGYVGDDSRLLFNDEKNITVYGFLKVNNDNNVVDSYCPFAVVRVHNDNPALSYLSMFGEFTSTPSKTGVLYYQYMNRQISLDEIPFGFIKDSDLFRKAIVEEEYSRRINLYIDKAEETNKHIDYDGLYYEMEGIERAFKASSPEEFFDLRLASFANAKYEADAIEKSKQEYLTKQKELQNNCFGTQALPIDYGGEQD